MSPISSCASRRRRASTFRRVPSGPRSTTSPVPAAGWNSRGRGLVRVDSAYRLYDLALAGAPEVAAMNRFRDFPGLPTAARHRLAGRLAPPPMRGAAWYLTRGLSDEVAAYPGMVDYTYGADIRDRAVILDALNTLGDAGPRLAGLRPAGGGPDAGPRGRARGSPALCHPQRPLPRRRPPDSPKTDRERVRRQVRQADGPHQTSAARGGAGFRNRSQYGRLARLREGPGPDILRRRDPRRQ